MAQHIGESRDERWPSDRRSEYVALMKTFPAGFVTQFWRTTGLSTEQIPTLHHGHSGVHVTSKHLTTNVQ